MRRKKEWAQKAFRVTGGEGMKELLRSLPRRPKMWMLSVCLSPAHRQTGEPSPFLRCNPDGPALIVRRCYCAGRLSNGPLFIGR